MGVDDVHSAMGESTGGPGRKPRVTDEELLGVFRRAETPVLTTQMVADEVPIGKRTVLDRLKALHRRGVIENMEVGARAQVWWLPDEDDEPKEQPDYMKGFGAFEGTDFAEATRRASEEIDAGFRERREHHGLGDEGDE